MSRLNCLAIIAVTMLAISAQAAQAQVWTLEQVCEFGNHPDLAVDSLGKPHIIFNNCSAWEVCEPDGLPELTYGTKDDTGWVLEFLSGDPAGFLTSIFVDDAGTPHIAYCDSNWQRNYGYRTGMGWTMENLDLLNPPYYRASPSLVVDDSGEPHMVCIERETVHYSHRVGGSWVDEHIPGSYLDNWSARAAICLGNQNSILVGTRQYYASAELFTLEEGVWTSELIDGAIAYNPWMVLDANGASHFVYHASALFYATNARGDWVEELVDDNYVNEANDIAVDASGRPFIAYTRPTMVSFSPLLFDLELLLTWRESGGWVSELVDTLYSVESTSMSPRLEVDPFGTIHLLYRWPSTGELRYGTRQIPGGAVAVPVARRRDAITGIIPNPFNPGTEISFNIEAGGQVSLSVYDIMGRCVREWPVTSLGEGEHSLRWDGKMDSGVVAPSGVYFFRLRSAQGVDTRRGILIK